MRRFARYLLAAVFLLTSVLLLSPQTAHAADQPITIKSCKLNSSGTKLTVKAKVKQKTSEMGKKLYLIQLNAYSSESGTKSATPIKSVKAKKGTVTFKVKYDSTMLYQKFVVACKKGGKYKYLSAAHYITNPETLATYKGKGPTASSKKGLQVEELSDSLEIGTQHAVINWTLNSILNSSATNKIAYKYRGKTYYLDADQIRRNDELVQAYNAAGVRVTIILLLPKDAASAGTKAMQYGGYSYTKFSSVKTSSKAGCRTFEAVMTYLASHYGTKENLVCGWILGNEVNSNVVWNYGGGKSLTSYVQNYARSFRICYNAVKSVNKNAKVYISLDNNWNQDVDGNRNSYFSSKAVLDKFYGRLKEQGNIVFQIAYHAYPQGMSDPVFWDDTLATNSTSSKIVNFKNLDVLTKYVKKNFGKKYTIMLSEQSFNTSRGELVQAAAYAYAYYLSESNSMIEAFIYGREFDHAEELKSGYYWGLCDTHHVKRLIWSVYQYIDSKDSFKFTDPLVKYTNLKKWTKISGMKRSKFTKMASKRQTGNITSVEPQSTTSVLVTWDKMNQGDGYEVFRNGVSIATISGNSNVTFLDKGLTTGATYQYQVRMYKEAPDSANANSRVRLNGSISPAVTVTVSTGTVKLNKDKCKVSGNEITVGWTKLSDASGYEISRSTEENGYYTPLATVAGSKSTYKDSATLSGTTYYYKVRAFVTVNGINYYGNYSESIGQQALIQLTASVVNGKVVLNWTQWQNATSYRAYCTPQSVGKYKWLKKTINGFEYSISKYVDLSDTKVDFAVGETYLFRVRAYYGKDANGDEIFSPYSNVVELKITQEIDGTGASQAEIDGGETAEPEGTESQEPESTETAEPEGTESTEPESTEAAEPEQTESQEPESTESQEPENTEAAKPEDTESTEPESTEAAEPEQTESTEPENTEAAEPERESANAQQAETESMESANAQQTEPGA